jgi:hypothetical protein
MFQVGDYVVYKQHLRGRARSIAIGIVVDTYTISEDQRAEFIALFGFCENDEGSYGVRWFHDKSTTDTHGSLIRKAAFKKFQKSS